MTSDWPIWAVQNIFCVYPIYLFFVLLLFALIIMSNHISFHNCTSFSDFFSPRLVGPYFFILVENPSTSDIVRSTCFSGYRLNNLEIEVLFHPHALQIAPQFFKAGRTYYIRPGKNGTRQISWIKWWNKSLCLFVGIVALSSNKLTKFLGFINFKVHPLKFASLFWSA